MRFFSGSLAIFDYYPDLYFRSGSTSSLPTRVVFKSSGDVGIGYSSPSYRLDVNGTARATSFITASDERLKKNIVVISNALTNLQKLNGVKYSFKENMTVKRKSTVDGEMYEESLINIVKDQNNKMGLIAQNVREIFPELVYEDNDGYLGVDYVSLIPVLIEAIKEQQAQIDILNKKILSIK